MSVRSLTVALGERSYAIDIGAGLIDDPARFAPHVRGRTVALVTNETVAPLYLPRLLSTLERAGARTHGVTLPDGEEHKTWQTLDLVFELLLKARLGRSGVIVALGGGVVGDIAGFAASTYQRGIAHLQVPTTLLAQVDSSVGGKTAINHALGKNMIGAFHQPVAVVADTSTLATLPPREYAAGLAEIVKYGAIFDAGFLDWIESHEKALLAREAGALAHAILRSCEIKADIVARAERAAGGGARGHHGPPQGPRHPCPAIESASGYGKLLHGEAVAIGMAMAARFSARLGRVPAADPERLTRLLERLGLPVQAPRFAVDTWLEYMGRDKKNEDGGITLILLDAMGRGAVVKDTPAAKLREFLEEAAA